MPRARQPSQQELRRMVDRLRALQMDPPRQRAFAFELLEAGVPASLLPTVVDALGPPFDAETRPLFLEAYRALARGGGKVDPGGEIRARLVDGIAANAVAADRDFFLEVLALREASMQLGLGPQVLHAAGLRGLRAVDPGIAPAVAIQLLNFYLVDQPYGQPRKMGITPSGEPVVTALRLLFDLGHDTAIFQGAALELLPPPAQGEALRLLVNLPPGIVSWLIERHSVSPQDEIAAGALDLALASPELDVSRGAVERALKGDNYDLVGYVAMSIAALRSPGWLRLLLEVAESETRDRSRLVSLLDAVRAVRGDPAAESLAEAMTTRITSLREAERSSNPAQDSNEDFVY